LFCFIVNERTLYACVDSSILSFFINRFLGKLLIPETENFLLYQTTLVSGQLFDDIVDGLELLLHEIETKSKAHVSKDVNCVLRYPVLTIHDQK